jgi:1,2-diacylglycerol 3-alpha-glucosyltransferase
MNIAFFSESYKPYLSGVTNSIETLKIALEKRGHKVIVFSPDYPGADDDRTVFRFPSMPSPYPGYRLAVPIKLKLLDILKRNKIQIVHSHSPYQLGVVSMHYAHKLEVPFVFTMHTMLGQYMHYVPLLSSKLTGTLTAKYVEWFCNKCDRIIVPTKSVEQSLIGGGIKTKIHIVPTGLNMELAAKADPKGIKEELGVPEDAKILLFVGRLAREKNIPFLFRAFEHMLKVRKDIYIVIAAAGPFEKYLRAIAPDNVIFAGQKPYPNVLNYYAAADMFIFSSFTETQGLVISEAMSCGLPQVVVKAEGVKDIVIDGFTGVLTPNSTNAFANHCLRLLNNPLILRTYSKNSIDTAKKLYSSEVFAQKIEQVYKSVL